MARTGLVGLLLAAGACGPAALDEARSGTAEAHAPPTAGGEAAPVRPGTTERAPAADAGARPVPPEPTDPGPPPVDDTEIAAARAFVDRLVSLAARGSSPRSLLRSVDWEYVGTAEASRGAAAPADEAAQLRWVSHLWGALRLECRRRPVAVQAFSPGAADGHFEAPLAGTPLVEDGRREAVARLRTALARSLVATSPCDPAIDPSGFDLLLRRAVDGEPAVRAFRRLEPRQGLRL